MYFPDKTDLPLTTFPLFVVGRVLIRKKISLVCTAALALEPFYPSSCLGAAKKRGLVRGNWGKDLVLLIIQLLENWKLLEYWKLLEIRESNQLWSLGRTHPAVIRGSSPLKLHSRMTPE